MEMTIYKNKCLYQQQQPAKRLIGSTGDDVMQNRIQPQSQDKENGAITTKTHSKQSGINICVMGDHP
jgi:hypothetical protein